MKAKHLVPCLNGKDFVILKSAISNYSASSQNQNRRKSVKSFVKTLIALVTLSFMFQGFECASSEMTSAKMAYTKKDYSTAQTFLEKEVKKNPKNGEAWFMLGKVRGEAKDVQGTVEAFKEARKYPLDKQKMDEMSISTYKLWADIFNGAIDNYNKAVKSEQPERQKLISEAIRTGELAVQLKPENTEIYNALASMYEVAGDTAKSISTMERYVETQQDALDLLLGKGIYMGMSRVESLKNLGAPDQTKGTHYGKDSIVTDHYNKLDGKEVYIFYRQDKNDFIFDGIRVNPPADMFIAEKERFSPFESSTFIILAYKYYQKKDYDKAQKNLNVAMRLKPSEQNAMQLQYQLLKEGGKSSEALKTLEDLVNKFPNEKNYIAQYGSLLSESKDYKGATAQFEKALKIDPNYDIALINLGAVYQNRAGIIQKEEQAKREKDKKYVEDTTRYFPLLLTAADYYQKYRNLPGKNTDIAVVQNLINIYTVLRYEDKLEALAGDVKSLESTNIEGAADCYDSLSTYYAKQGKGDKSQSYLDKAKALRGR